VPVSATEQSATAMGMSILSAELNGAPRLMRAISPRTPTSGLTPAAMARDHVAALASLWVQKAPPMELAEAGTQELRNGAKIVRLTQHVDGVPLEQGEMRVLMYENGSLAAVAGTLLPSTFKPVFRSSAQQALEHALDKHLGAARSQLAISDAGESDGWQQLSVAYTPDVQVLSARARREVATVGGELKEVWKVELESSSAPDALSEQRSPIYSMHAYVVLDANGQIVRDDDLVQFDSFLYRAYMEDTGNRRPLDGPLASFAPHPTGVPDGSGPALLPQGNLVVMEAFNKNADPWLASNATTTQGNNAEAFSDLDGNSRFADGDVRPAVAAGRVLNYVYDHTQEPFAADNLNAGVVNAFFMVNWMHDWYYDSGFTETTGVGQTDNFGRGGVANDSMIVAAQAGANVGSRNNASMATPADGARPRMRMFLWTAGTNTALITPSGPIHSGAFSAGPRNYDLTGDLMAAADGTDPASDACQAVTNNLTGKIALVIYSGVCNSSVIVPNVKAAGAIGIVLVNGASDSPSGFGGSAAAKIPGLVIGKTDGLALQAALAAGPVTVELQSAVAGVERDGDLDNTVVGHEWGHYLHHRLAICGGSQQCGGMSEGWADFNALMMMAREGDNRNGVYAMAPYALDDGVTQNTAYFGIRRFPYSRDRTKNDLSFRHIGDENALPTTTPGFPGGPNSEVHNTGEIWATMMWEAFNVVADAHGVNVARRRMADYIVAGLLLTPPNATFTEQRDGLLAGASALDSDDMLLMAAAFAGRGAGSCAVSPDRNSPTNTGVVESGTLAAKLTAGGLSLTDDGISCDHDGYLDPGESGTLHLKVANSGIIAAENVAITATTSTPGIRLGAPIKMAALGPFSGADLAIPVTVLATAARNTLVTINIRVTGEQTCDKMGINVPLTLRIGADDMPSASTVDHADTLISPWTATGATAATLWGRTLDTTGNSMFFGKDSPSTSDTQFASPPLQVSTTQPLVVTLKQAYNFEAQGTTLFDGGVIEVSLNGGTTWSDVTAFGVNPGYTGPLAGGPLAARQAFGGMSPGYPALNALTLNFGTVFAGLPVMLRFRISTDAVGAAVGWNVDDVAVSGITNTPFPQLVVEPSTCTARRVADDGGVVAAFGAPATSLGAFDAACVLQENKP
jgi:hypothetical protein